MNRTDLDAVVFDVVGTLVDEVGSIRAETGAVVGPAVDDLSVPKLIADQWLDGFDATTRRVAAGDAPWEPDDAIRRRVLGGLLDDHGVRLAAGDFERLARAGRRLVPWPGAAEQLGRLARLVPVMGLTNAGVAQIAEISARGGLRWHMVFSTDLVRTFKPDPAAYRLPVDLLGADPARLLFLAAHPWDLRGAAGQGYRTAYLPREHADRPEDTDRFDVTLTDLDDLTSALGAH